MEELDNILDRDTFETADPAITFGRADQTWTITAGVVASSGNNDGVLSAFAGSKLVNNGTILSAGRDKAGLEMTGADISVSNAAGAAIDGAKDGIVIDGKTADIDNHGSILGLTNIGVDFHEHSDDVTLTNSGSIFGRSVGIEAFSNLDGGVISNSGVVSSDHVGIRVWTNDGLTTTIGNAVGGTIRGADAAIKLTDAGGISLDNHGAVIGDIDIDVDVAETDVIVNHGKIKGAVFLGGGNDVFTGTGGTSGAVFGSTGNDRLVGGSAADKLFGGLDDDRLIGAGGNDRLDGGFGIDTLIGGSGRDQFVFRSGLDAGHNVDRITDFTVHLDTIVLTSNFFPGIGHGVLLAEALFHVGAAAHDANDRIIYNPNNGFLTYDANGNHPGGATHFATLAPHLALTHADFFVTQLLVE